jgi:flagellar hook-length control protein FliK
MDTHRVGTGDPILLLTRAADKLLSLQPGEVIRAQVAEVLPGGEVNLRIQGNLFRARSMLQLPENASVLFRVLGQKTGESVSEIRLQFLEVIAQSETGQLPQRSVIDPLQTLTQELASNLAGKTQLPGGLAATVERLLKALPDDPSRIPAGTREQLLTLLQTSLRTTGQSIQDRMNLLFRQFIDQDHPQVLELAKIKEQVFADIEMISQTPLKSTLANTGVGLEARLRLLAEALAEGGDRSLSIPLSAIDAEQPSGTAPLSPGQQSAPPQSDLQADPLHSDFKARLLQIREMILEEQAQLLELDLSTRIAEAGSLKEKRAMLEQMLQSVDGLLQDVETFQLLSRLTDSFYTFLPFLWEGLKEAEIAFKRSGSGPQGRSYYCLVHLDLEELGELDVVAMMAGSEFLVSFKTDHDTFRSVLNARLNELQQMFAAKGLKLGLVSFYGLREKQLAPFERLEAFESIINIRI